MKNKILLGLVSSSFVVSAAMADVYVGVEYGAASNTHEIEASAGAYTATGDYDNDYSNIKLKIGAGEDGGVKLQGTLSFISYDESIFDETNKDYVEFGLDLIKEFEVNKQLYPFIKGGMGVGAMDVEGYTEDSILAVSFNLGAGLSFKATDNISLLAGVDYVYRKWQDIEVYYNYYTTVDVSVSDSGFKPYIGLNVQF